MSGISQEIHYDFSVINPTGYAIYYRIIDEENHWVEATYPCQNGDNYWWGYDQPEGKLILTDTVSYSGIDYTLVGLGDHVFCGCTGLRGSIELPQTLSFIGECAFKGCSNLNGDLNIPTMVKRIENEAFCDCSGLSGTLTLSDSLTFIGVKAFYRCSSLSGVLSIPNKVTEIGDSAFEQCSGFDDMMTLPNTLEQIGEQAFKGSSNIKFFSVKCVNPPVIAANAFDDIPTEIPVYVPYNTKDAYRNASGWSRFGEKIIEKSLWNGTAEPWTKGSGTEDDPYLIESAENLAWLANSINNKIDVEYIIVAHGSPWADTVYIDTVEVIYHDSYVYRDTCFQLVADLDLQSDYGLLWNPIGNKHYGDNGENIDYCNYFCGHFDGNDHEIGNYKMNATFAVQNLPYYYGLFGIVMDGTLENVVVKRFFIDVHGHRDKCIGGVAGKCLNSKLTNCHSIAGWLHCGQVNNGGGFGSAVYDSSVGGVVGVAEKSLIKNCSGAGVLKVVSEPTTTTIKSGVGGVVGLFLCDDQPNENNTISGCSFNGTIEAIGCIRQANGGGIVGLCASVTEGTGVIEFEKCFSKGVLHGSCFNWGEPRPVSSGGIVGCVGDIESLSVMNCYSNDSLPAFAQGTSSYVGGIIGKANPNTSLFVKNCYHAGSIISYHKGGIIAQNTNMTVVRNCYFDQSVAPDDGFGLPVDKEYMKTAAFVNQLNNGSTVYMMDQEPYVNDGYPIFGTDGLIFVGAEWYYEILNDDGSITYQHLQCTGDTTINGKRPKIIVRSNTHYDRGEITEVTHEYVYEENGEVYWWNKELQDFTLLYDFSAEVGDEWEIKVGSESFVTRVYEMETYMIDGIPYKKMTIGDADNIFSGTLVSTIGHLTSFFPENLMIRNKGYHIEGLRCYWLDSHLLLKIGDRDCDEVYQQLHNGVDETEKNGFEVYPNPANNILFVRLPQCDSPTMDKNKYLITNLMGQTILQGSINAENQQIDITDLPTGMYFINIGEQTMKFVKQ